MNIFRRFFPGAGFVLLFLLPVSCFSPRSSKGETSAAAKIQAAETGSSKNTEFAARLNTVILNAELPPDLAGSLRAAAGDPLFKEELRRCLAVEYALRELVDKAHALSPGYVPSDLVLLESGSYLVNKTGMTIRKEAAESLEKMAAAALADGITLLVSSAYRSFEYQEGVYNRNVREMGREAADRESARPGRSQHQSGLVADFGSIDDSFAQTPAGLWMTANAPRFGWSLSFPDGYEAVTGYRWESWHFRYTGMEITAFINRRFGGIQQYALRFLYEWEKMPDTAG